jgi:aminopeptidase N
MREADTARGEDEAEAQHTHRNRHGEEQRPGRDGSEPQQPAHGRGIASSHRPRRGYHARAHREERVPAKKRIAKRKPAAAKPALRPHRLAADVRPTEVDVQVEVDPASGPAFSGQVTHRLHLDQRRRSLELHADDLSVTGALVEAAGRRLKGRILRHPERETIEVQLREAIPAGDATLTLSFRGKLRSDLRGLYAAAAGERKYAFTQLEAADARRFFPCFDEPALKARFRLSVTTSTRNTVLSNNPVEKIEPLGRGRKTVHFRRTPPLSTYLLALAVGELVASEPVHCGETEIRVWHVPGKQHLTQFGLEAARETLARLEAYFDLPYPYDKLDLVAAPDFEAGAMENAGAVFFRETLLLVDPETATLSEKKRAAEVICHELAHMWYGDLVTMAWWDDLWLNEAFATWMAFQVVDAWKPEWKMWNDFQHHRAAALGLDALAETHPIYMKVRTPSEATQNFDLIRPQAKRWRMTESPRHPATRTSPHPRTREQRRAATERAGRGVGAGRRAGGARLIEQPHSRCCAPPRRARGPAGCASSSTAS